MLQSGEGCNAQGRAYEYTGMRELGDLLEFVNGGLCFVMFLRRRYKQEEGIAMPPPPFMLMVNLEVSVQLCCDE